jgi:hypothetical protein
MNQVITLIDYLPRRYDLDLASLENLLEETKAMLRGSRELEEKPLAFHAVAWKESDHGLFTLYMPQYPGLEYEFWDPSRDLFLSSLPKDYLEGFVSLGDTLDFTHFTRKVEKLKTDALGEGRTLGSLSFHLIPQMQMYKVYNMWYKA